MSKAKKITLWVLLGLSTLAFLAAGLGKLAGVEELHKSFALMGLPVWFGYFIGASELAGAIGLWLRKLSVYAASGLIIIMLGATYFHVAYESVANAVPAIILIALLGGIIALRKQQAA
ncbi:MAG: DoxX family protein [Paraglaciecola sp.]|uniref:DoxX family protein n=1 Tax=Pseudomonadati TaxID=3379134 RepID=UPI00273CFF47|nr:DoxX family protein [Paraglaciecola sp.]MDP5029893.1 DoxX family protein [Paraglaciecola sp.]MDP5041350.1 DoxX family protein [Paraglaciecola sp.]MDP5134005.1 DoxX family protein [Paraglaciecola sp.]